MARSFLPANTTCCGFVSGGLVNYAPLQLAVPTNGDLGSVIPVDANEVIINNQPIGDSVTRILEFISDCGSPFKVEAKFTVTDQGGQLVAATSGGISHTGSAGNGSYMVEFTSIECDENGDLLPFSIALRATSFQVANERWWADGTSTQGLELTAVDTFLNANGTVGTYPATGIFGTGGTDQAARIIAYENKTYIRARWLSDGGAGSAILPYLYEAPATAEEGLCEIKDRLSNKIEASADDLRKYVDENAVVDLNTNTLTGLYLVSTHSALPAGIPTTATIITGHDFTQATNMTLRLHIRDEANNQGWGVAEIDVDNMLERFNAGSATDAWVTFFDNDYVTINVVNAATGEITLTEVGRQFEYMKSELIAPASSLGIATDTFGTAQQATAALTTTNGVAVAIGDYYIEFPDGTTYAVAQQDELNDTIITAAGAINADTIVSFLPDNVGRKFHATANTNFSFGNTATVIVDGVQTNGVASPHAVPQGAQGWVHRDSAGNAVIVYQTAQSFILTSPNGTNYELSVDNSGGLITTAV